ncbi:MAG: ribosomal-processing cysteine protease Prp [Roseburia sp.]|nr:ribosomal-processing cysteine protease Prp [Roseburia sp.]
MIRVRVKKSDSGKVTGFNVSGHAGFAKAGTDVVCAGVSALVINCINSIEQFSDTRFDLVQNEQDGVIDFSCKEPLDDKAVLLMKSLFLGVQEIQDTYGNEYVTFD